MDYNTLLDMTGDLCHRLAMCGAETFRVEETANRIMAAYNIQAEIFAIPNCITISIETPEGKPMTRMRRVGLHGTDLDSVERYNLLSRKICAQKPEPKEALIWLKETTASLHTYSTALYLLGNFIGGAGWGIFFGGGIAEGLLAGLCGLLIGLISRFTTALKVNDFFATIFSAFAMSLLAYGAASLGFVGSADTAIIGALMILVPGLLFTNAMRDIIYGDTNSGTNRIVQVILIAVAIALGTGAAYHISASIWGGSPTIPTDSHPLFIQIFASFIGGIGFAIIYNVCFPGALLCTLGGALTWAIYGITFHISKDVAISSLFAAIFAAIYAETMARIRKYPAISYLVISIFPLLPGAGVYYTTYAIVNGNMDAFSSKGMETISIAGALAIGILLVSTLVRLWSVWKHRKN
jgi:uncharacterized membrane protein YjjP (DUF1212 family)